MDHLSPSEKRLHPLNNHRRCSIGYTTGYVQLLTMFWCGPVRGQIQCMIPRCPTKTATATQHCYFRTRTAPKYTYAVLSESCMYAKRWIRNKHSQDQKATEQIASIDSWDD